MNIIKDSLWANSSAFLSQIIGLVASITVARYIGPYEFGLISIGLVILFYFQRFLCLKT